MAGQAPRPISANAFRFRSIPARRASQSLQSHEARTDPAAMRMTWLPAAADLPGESGAPITGRLS
jgi:hypothetical protein